MNRNHFKTPTKILVVNVNWLGDVIFSTPVFQSLKAQYPDAQISCLAVPRVREILECCPAVDEIIVYEEQGRHRGLWGKMQFLRMLKRKNFTIAFLLHRSWTRAALLFLAGIPERVGWDTKGRGWLLTKRLAVPAATRHRSDVYLSVIEGYGIPVLTSCCTLQVPPASSAAVNRRLSELGIGRDDEQHEPRSLDRGSIAVLARGSGQGPVAPDRASLDKLVIVNVGGNWDLKRWPKDNFAELVRRLTRELGVKVVLPGGADDKILASDIAASSGVQPLVLAGQTSLKELLALMKQADLVISADSGPMHVASAVGTKGIGIFGPTRPEITGPRGTGEVVILQKDVGCNRSACYNLDCRDNICMKAVTVEDVFSAAKNLLGVPVRL